MVYALLTVGAASAATFEVLPDVPGGTLLSAASDLSDDGSITVGLGSSTASGAGQQEAARWSVAGGASARRHRGLDFSQRGLRHLGRWHRGGRGGV